MHKPQFPQAATLYMSDRQSLLPNRRRGLAGHGRSAALLVAAALALAPAAVQAADGDTCTPIAGQYMCCVWHQPPPSVSICGNAGGSHVTYVQASARFDYADPTTITWKWVKIVNGAEQEVWNGDCFNEPECNYDGVTVTATLPLVGSLPSLAGTYRAIFYDDGTGRGSSPGECNPIFGGGLCPDTDIPPLGCGSIASNDVTVTITPVLTLPLLPYTEVACLGSTVTLDSLIGYPADYYIWTKNFIELNDGDDPRIPYTHYQHLNIYGITAADAGDYRCTAVAPGGCTESAGPYTLHVTGTAPTVTQQPVSLTLCKGDTAIFTVHATNADSYTWDKNGIGVVGTTNQLTLTNIKGADTARYNCRIANGCSQVLVHADLTVSTQPTITTQPAAVVTCLGGSASLNVIATGADNTYQWKRKNTSGVFVNLSDGVTGSGTTVAGSNTSTLTLTDVASNMVTDYYCVIDTSLTTCGNNSVTSNTVAVTLGNPAAITAQPGALSLCAGDTASFTVATTGSAPLTYAWYDSAGNLISDGTRHGTTFSGAATATLTLTNIDTSDADSYHAVVGNNCNSVSSNDGALAVAATVPVITDPPDDHTSCIGGGAIFTVTASGGNLSYRWQRQLHPGDGFLNISDGTNGSGVTSSGALTAQLLLSGVVTTTDPIRYRCQVTNSCGTVFSPAATHTVLTPVSITQDPVAQSACPGGTITLTAAGTGGGTLTYRWSRSLGVSGTNPFYNLFNGPLSGGSTVSGVTSPTLVISNLNQNDTLGYAYHCRVSNGGCSAVSNFVVLSTATPVQFSTQPSNVSVCQGRNATFTFNVLAQTTDPISYRWQKDNVDLAGGSGVPVGRTVSYTVSNVTAADVGSYTCIVTNACGSATTSAATLSISGIPAGFSTQPIDVSQCTGQNAVFSVVATGSPAPTYQWQKKNSGSGSSFANLSSGSGVAGATTATLTLSGSFVQFDDDQSTYRCILTNSCGSNTSSTATLTVNNSPTFITSGQPQPRSVCAGANTHFSVTATGSNDTYQWQRNNNTDLADVTGHISGSTTSQLTITGVLASDAANYRCRVTNECGTLTSSNAALTVSTVSPTITSQPLPKTICTTPPGPGPTFTVAATGGNLAYQWQESIGAGTFVNLSDGPGTLGSLGSSLFLSGSGLAAGDYRCIVSNACGTLTSNAVPLTLQAGVAPDLDGDCDVDSSDFNLFRACATRSGVPRSPACAARDFDNDGDVDMDDFALFQRCYSGANKPVNPNCSQ